MLKQNTFSDELFSSAFTLSDMEMFIFPDLLFALVLANILSPRLWQWKRDPWFSGLDKLNANARLHRLKQYIMDHYAFNLDLETWGLTNKDKELQRFRGYVSEDALANSNALFGYEGDKYYFSIDIRRHFGLDKYTTDIIPYWKTETIEAMDAFVHKSGYETGAGECVSLSALYVAAAFVVLEIPLQDIFLIATPLHSQSFINQGKGCITNNRRIVTKSMWYNGSVLSEKAQRALRNEQVTYVSHLSGHIHYLYDQATIDQTAYEHFSQKLADYLHTPVDADVFANFLRCHPDFQRFFLFKHSCSFNKCYIPAEDLYKYEVHSKHLVNAGSRKNLLSEIEDEDFNLTCIPERLVFDEVESLLKTGKFSFRNEQSILELREIFMNLPEPDKLLAALKDFTFLHPCLPDRHGKIFSQETPLELTPGMGREDVWDYLVAVRDHHPVVDLAFYAGRYCQDKEWLPFLKAAIERNPVSLEYFKDETPDETYALIRQMPEGSIYGPNQFAQPDEVINFLRADGLEKAFLLANVLINKYKLLVVITAKMKQIELLAAGQVYLFGSDKNVVGVFRLSAHQQGFDPG